MDVELSVPIILLAFVCELVDSSLGMGYGTTLTPILLLFGYDPIVIVPAVLFSEFLPGSRLDYFNTNSEMSICDLEVQHSKLQLY